MKALPLSDAFASLVPETTIYLHASNEMHRCTIKALRRMNKNFILSCHEIADRNRASLFRGAMVMLLTDSLPRGEGEYLREEIIGLTAVTTEGDVIGRIVDIIDTAAHDVYIVTGDKEYLIPAVREFIAEIRLDKKMIFVKKMQGLFD